MREITRGKKVMKACVKKKTGPSFGRETYSFRVRAREQKGGRHNYEGGKRGRISKRITNPGIICPELQGFGEERRREKKREVWDKKGQKLHKGPLKSKQPDKKLRRTGVSRQKPGWVKPRNVKRKKRPLYTTRNFLASTKGGKNQRLRGYSYLGRRTTDLRLKGEGAGKVEKKERPLGTVVGLSTPFRKGPVGGKKNSKLGRATR